MDLPPSGFSDPSAAARPPAAGVPFEGGGGFFQRFADQLLLVTTDPVGAGRALGGEPAPLGPSLLFSLVASTLAYGPVLLLASCVLMIVPTLFAAALPPELAAVQGGMFCVLVGALPFLVVFGHLFSDLLFAGSFHLCALVAGGRGTFSQSLRTLLYARGVTAWLLPCWLIILLLSCIPFLPALLQFVLRLALVVWAGFTLYGAAQAVHGLNQDRAVLVAVLSLLLGVVGFFALSAGLGVAAALLTAGSLSAFGNFSPN